MGKETRLFESEGSDSSLRAYTINHNIMIRVNLLDDDDPMHYLFNDKDEVKEFIGELVKLL